MRQRKHQGRGRRGLSLLLTLCMALTLLPAAALAADPGAAIEVDGSTETLAGAIERAVSGDILKLTAPIDLGETGVTITDKALTLDLNGQTITCTPEIYSEAGGVELAGTARLTVTDSGGSGVLENKGGSMTWALKIGAGCAVTLEGGTVAATGESASGVSNAGTLTVEEGGAVSMTGNYGGSGIGNLSGGVLNITGGSVTMDCPYPSGNAIHNGSGGRITITGGEVASNNDGIYNYGGEVEIAGSAEVSSSGEAAISNHDNTSYTPHTEGVVRVKGSAVVSTTGSEYTIQNWDKGPVEISENAAVRASENGTAIRSAGPVTVSGSAAVSATGDHGVAIYNTYIGKITVSDTALVTSQATLDNGGTISFAAVPGSPAPVLEIQGGTVENTALGGCAVYFSPDTGVTAATVSEYYTVAGNAAVGKVYPSADTAEPVALWRDGAEVSRHAALQGAIDAAAQSGDTLKITAFVDLGDTGVTIDNKSLTLDLNGQLIVYYKQYGGTSAVTLQNGAQLTVTDGSADGQGALRNACPNGAYALEIKKDCAATVAVGTVEATGEYGSGIDNYGTLTVAGGAVKASGINTSFAIRNQNDAACTVTGGSVLVGGTSGIAIENTGAGTVTVEGNSVVTSGGAALRNSSSNGTINVSGSALISSSGGYGISNGAQGSVHITGGTVRMTGTGTDHYAIYNSSDGAVNVSGGVVEAAGAGTHAICNVSDGTIALSGNAQVSAAGAGGTAVANVANGEIRVSGDARVSSTGAGGTAIYNGYSDDATGSVTVEGSAVVSARSGDAQAIFNYSIGKLTVGGTATVTSEATEKNGGTIYIYTVPDEPAVVLDIQGGSVENTAPEGYAVYFVPAVVTADNVGDYYTVAGGAAVGKVHPAKREVDSTIGADTTADEAAAMLGGPDMVQVTGGPGSLSITLKGNIQRAGALNFAGGAHILDLNGCAVTGGIADNGCVQVQSGSLTLRDGKGGGVLTNTSRAALVVMKDAGLTVEGGTLQGGWGEFPGTDSPIRTFPALQINCGGSVTLRGGVFRAGLHGDQMNYGILVNANYADLSSPYPDAKLVFAPVDAGIETDGIRVQARYTQLAGTAGLLNGLLYSVQLESGGWSSPAPARDAALFSRPGYYSDPAALDSTIRLYPPSSAKQITAFTMEHQVGQPVIDQQNHTIAVTMPAGTDVTSLAPAITVSDNAAVSPASGTAQDFTSSVNYTVTAQDGSTQTYTVTVTVQLPSGTAPSITTGSLPGGTVGTPYSQTLAATGTTPITWSISGGSLPTGLAWIPDTGVITGTPSVADTFSFTVKAANAIGEDTRELSIAISAPEATVTGVTVTPDAVTVEKGATQQFSAAVTGENAPPQDVTWTIEGSHAGGTTITDGLLSVASDETEHTLTVKATSVADNTKSATAIVTVTDQEISRYTLTVTDGSGSGDYAAGAEITVTAETKADKRFRAWTASGITLDDATRNPITITMPAGAVTLSATYDDVYTVTFDANGGTVTPAAAQTGADGKLQSLPTPTRGGSFRFDCWQLSDGTRVTTDTVFTAHTTITAHWSYTGGGTDDGSSGSSSSGGGSYTPPAIAEPQPNTPTTAETDVSARTDSKGSAEIDVPSRVVDNAIDKALDAARESGAEENGVAVQINVATGKSAAGQAAGILIVNLPKATQERLISGNVERFTLVIDQPDLAISLNLDSIREIYTQANADVQLTAARITDTSALSAEARAAIGTRPAFQLTATYRGGRVTDFGAGSVSLEIPYTLQEGELAGSVCAIYVDDDGKVTYLTNSSYDAERGVVLFSTGHFSIYGIGCKTPTVTFSDIANHWAREDIGFVASRGLLNGTGDSEFSPDGAMTRGMFIAALGRLAGIDAGSPGPGTFSDVPADAYYATYVEWAAREGIVQGTGGGAFSPDAAVTRQEMAVILSGCARAMGRAVPAAREAVTFADSAGIAPWAAGAVEQMQRAGVLTGGDGNRFDPTAPVTRAQASTTLRRYLELVIDGQTPQG